MTAVKFYTTAGGKEDSMKKKMSWEEYLEERPDLENNDRSFFADRSWRFLIPPTRSRLAPCFVASGGTGSGPEEREDD